MKIYTIGHSTRLIDNFIDILKKYKIKVLVDVRSIPRSRYNPQYDQFELEKSLNNNNIEYIHMEGLGGFRVPVNNSINMGWRNKRFRGFADHMQSKEFKDALKKLINIAKNKNTVIMCSEALPWRCHRSLIADNLILYKFKVIDIFDKNKIQEHKLTSWAKIHNHNIIYP